MRTEARAQQQQQRVAGRVDQQRRPRRRRRRRRRGQTRESEGDDWQVNVRSRTASYARVWPVCCSRLVSLWCKSRVGQLQPLAVDSPWPTARAGSARRVSRGSPSTSQSTNPSKANCNPPSVRRPLFFLAHAQLRLLTCATDWTGLAGIRIKQLCTPRRDLQPRPLTRSTLAGEIRPLPLVQSSQPKPTPSSTTAGTNSGWTATEKTRGMQSSAYCSPCGCRGRC